MQRLPDYRHERPTPSELEDEEIVHANVKTLGLKGFFSFFDIISMNWEYISGFFDAAGSITLSNPGNSRFKTVFITFHNNEIEIIIAIEKFINKQLKIKGKIVIKPGKKANHNTSYDLRYDYLSKCVLILKYMNLNHPKKNHRSKIALELYSIRPRNGKYSQQTLLIRQMLEKEFFKK